MTDFRNVEVVKDSRTFDFMMLGEDLCAMIREALVIHFGNRVCTATFQEHRGEVEVYSHCPLSEENVGRFRETVESHVRTDDVACTRLRFIINHEPENRYNYDNQCPEFKSLIPIPLSLQLLHLGTLYVASFDQLNLDDEPIINELRRDLFGSLKKLWDVFRGEAMKFQRMVSRTIDGIILTDTDKTIQFVNTRAERILGLDSDSSWTGRPLSALGATYLTDFLEEALSHGMHEINKVVTASEKKTKLLGVHTELLKGVHGEEIGWMIVLRDVTTNWQNDQMRSALTIASHEIKTPLNSILSSVNLLLEQDFGVLSENQQRCLNVIKDDTQRLNRLLSDMLDLSRFDEGVQFIDRRKQVALSFLVDKVIDSFRIQAQAKGIRVRNAIPKSIPTFRGDRDRLQQILSNLVENSIKYSLNGGEVQIGARLKSSILKCWVKDHGVGIPDGKHEIIFERFRQLDNYPGQGHRGYGLGLSIAKQIVEGFDGKIWVDSKPKSGSTFYFTIPV